MRVEAYFEVMEQGSPSRFVIKLVEPAKIDHARRIACGREKRRVHAAEACPWGSRLAREVMPPAK